MKKPSLPANEEARLLSLKKLQILDTQPEERFDRITRTAKLFFDVDICLVSLLDSDRQWFKSNQGLDGVSQTSRELSFCAHAILNNEVMVVNDAKEDSRFANNPFVSGGPMIRFYAGAPISCPNNFALGTLCIIDSKPRKFSATEMSVLKDFAGMVEDQIRLSSEATVDKLTSVLNRRGFEMISKQMLSVSKRLKTKTQLLFFDLDGLKRINDQFGHHAGDQMLRYFGTILEDSFRESDLIARIGGDEFVVLLNGDEHDANTAVDRLRTAADQSSKSELKWSVGIVEYNPDRHRTLSDFLSDADARMYQDKRSRKSYVE